MGPLPVISATWEAKAGGSLEPRRQKLQLECNGTISAHSNLYLLGSSDSTDTASQASVSADVNPKAHGSPASEKQQQDPIQHAPAQCPPSLRLAHHASPAHRVSFCHQVECSSVILAHCNLCLPVKAQRASGRHTYRYIFAAHGPGHSQWRSPTGRQRDPFGWRGFFAGASAQRLLVRSKRD
ncbi:hypothetical protein AAY473_022464 [Plecturocebus cupreus]